jgi:sterol desaturase/sphingolipid hydroxylase (fatty acid hydroxylase superfamily)
LNPDTFRLFVFFLILGLMFTIETFKPARAWTTPRKNRLFFHAGLSMINTVILRILALAPLVMLLEWTRVQEWGIRHLLGPEGAGEIILGLVAYDFYDYWWHRANHRIPFLWRFHKVHHIDTHVDVTTSLRFHPGELLWSVLAKAFWIMLWGPSLWAYAVMETGITAFSQFHHSNFSLPPSVEKIIRLVHITPRIHTSHHTLSDRTRSANFCTIFSCWDRIFGTFREPDDHEMETLGLPIGRDTYLKWSTVLKAPFSSP